MTYPPDNNNPYAQQPSQFYEPPRGSSADKLVRLAVTFNYISAGLDALLCLLGFGLGTMFLVVPDMPHNAGDPPPQFMGAIYLFMGVFALVILIVKLIGTRKLQRRGPGAWGWGLTSAIVGAAQFFCGSCCWLQVAAGVYAIIILCQSHVKELLRGGGGA